MDLHRFCSLMSIYLLDILLKETLTVLTAKGALL